jgi:hypothetical protein
MLPVARYQEVRAEAAGLMRRLNRAGDGRMVLDSDYLFVVARRSPR